MTQHGAAQNARPYWWKSILVSPLSALAPPTSCVLYQPFGKQGVKLARRSISLYPSSHMGMLTYLRDCAVLGGRFRVRSDTSGGTSASAVITTLSGLSDRVQRV